MNLVNSTFEKSSDLRFYYLYFLFKMVRETIWLEWTYTNHSYNLKVSIPVGAKASIYMLVDGSDKVTWKAYKKCGENNYVKKKGNYEFLR